MLREEIDYYTTHYRGLPPDDDEEAWAFIDDQQLRDLNIRLAICRIKAHKMLEGQELSDAELREMYPPSTLEENGYFECLECDFEWYFDPEKCQFAHLQDYQRLALRSNGEYGYADWELYHSICSPLESDEEFVQFWEKLSSKTKWIKNFLDAESSVWERMQRVAFYHAVKIARGLPNIFSPLLCGAFNDYISSVTFDNTVYVYRAHLYLEIWKLVAKHKMNFEDALNQVKDNKDIHISCRLQVEAKIRNEKLFRPGIIRHYYDTYVADISDDLTDAEAYKLVMEAVKKFVPKHKSYYDYAKKKLDIAEKIGLITPHSTQKLNVAEQFRGHWIY